MTDTMKGKVALVTGGAAGIGRATALLFSEKGAKVVVADVTTEEGQDIADLIRKNGGEAIFVRCDVSMSKEVEALVNETAKTYGRLDYAFNNAGIEGKTAPTADCSEENWDRTVAINLTGVWLCMKHEIPQMLKQRAGAIVNNSSVAGIVGFAGLPAYVATKHGVVGLTKTAALEYAKQGIRVNAVCPGVIKTAMVERVIGGNPSVEAQFVAIEPIGRLGDPREVAEAVVWLCSDAASFVTGIAMPVDGGFVAP